MRTYTIENYGPCDNWMYEPESLKAKDIFDAVQKAHKCLTTDVADFEQEVKVSTKIADSGICDDLGNYYILEVFGTETGISYGKVLLSEQKQPELGPACVPLFSRLKEVCKSL